MLLLVKWQWVTLTKQLGPAETALPVTILVKKELFTEPEALFVKSTPSLLPKTLMLVASTNTGFTVVVALMAAFVFVKSQSRTNSEPCVVKLALIPLVPWFWKWQSFTKTRWQRV